MKKMLLALGTRLGSLETNELRYWLGLIMLLIGLSWSISLWVALAVVGAGIAFESTVTSYLAMWFSSRTRIK